MSPKDPGSFLFTVLYTSVAVKDYSLFFVPCFFYVNYNYVELFVHQFCYSMDCHRPVFITFCSLAFLYVSTLTLYVQFCFSNLYGLMAKFHFDDIERFKVLIKNNLNTWSTYWKVFKL